MKNENNKTNKKAMFIFFASACLYIAAIVSFIKGNNSTGFVFLCLGSAFLCFGSTYLNKSNENKDGGKK